MKRQTCTQCERPMSVCFCHCISTISNKWPIWIFQHHSEKKHAIGTAKIVNMSLNNILFFDTKTVLQDNKPLQEIALQEPILVYPDDAALDISDFKNTPPQPLLFLDGSWRKTRKILFDYPELNKLKRLAIKPQSISRYKIRKAPNESAISTLEAVVFTLSQLEDSAKKYQPMLDTMDWIINKQIEYMGEKTYLKNYHKLRQ